MSITEEDVEINVTMKPKGFDETKDKIEGVDKASEKAGATYRTLGRDTMMVGRSLSVLNRYFLGNNDAINKMVAGLYGLTSVLRMASIAEEVLGSKALRNAAAHTIEMLAIQAKTASLAVMHALLGPVGWAILAGAGIIAGTAIASVGAKNMRSMQGGGVVTQTGPHLLHAGEVVTNPKLGQGVGHTFINVDMKTGPISSHLDVERMLVDMSGRIADVNRRRTGHG